MIDHSRNRLIYSNRPVNTIYRPVGRQDIYNSPHSQNHKNEYYPEQQYNGYYNTYINPSNYRQNNVKTFK